MDTSLINLIPNLTAQRSVTIPRCEYVDPPPPYTPAPCPSPQRKDNHRSVGVPLHIEVLGATEPGSHDERPILWSRDDNIALMPDTTYGEFLGILKRKLGEANVSRDTGQWEIGILAETRGRTVWQFKKQYLDVSQENWDKFMKGLGESRYKGMKVFCRRADVVTKVDKLEALGVWRT